MKNRPFVLLICFYLISRFLIIFFNTETISYELLRGTLAKELIEGLSLPLANFTTDAYSLAAPFNAMLTVPFFLLFGKTLFALKTVPIIWHLGSLVAWYFVWRDGFDKKRTFFILLLFILSPPVILQYMTANHGTHFELILWTALSILVLRLVLRQRLNPILLGFLGGFSSTMSLDNLFTVLAILIYVAWKSKEEKLKFYSFYGLGFVFGFAPWLFYNARHGWEGLDIVEGHFFYRPSLANFLENFKIMFLHLDFGLRKLLRFESLPRPWGFFWTIGYEFIYLASLIYCAVRWLKSREGNPEKFDVRSFALLYQVLFFGILFFLQNPFGMQYYFPVVPFIGMTIVSALTDARPFFRRAVLGFCVVTGLMGHFSLMHWDQKGEILHRAGYSYAELGKVLAANFSRDENLFHAKVKTILQGKSAAIERDFYEGIGEQLCHSPKEKMPWFASWIRKDVEPQFHPILYKWYGCLWSDLDPQNFLKKLDELQISPASQGAMLFGILGTVGTPELEGFPGEGRVPQVMALCAQVPSHLKTYCYEGIGRSLGDFVGPSQIDSAYLFDYYRGRGR